MRLVVFAHVPPPHHGQAVMVQHLIEGLCQQSENGDITFWHVNARMSDDIADVGGIRLIKLLRLFRYCVQAIWLRIRFGADTLYYVPAPAKKSAIVRDWMVMALVRPWFRRTVFHWHAFGLGHWATATPEFPAGENAPSLAPPRLFGAAENIARAITRILLRRADLSIVLTEYNRSDAALLSPRKVDVVPNGIPDPCPDFEETVLPERLERLAMRRKTGKSIAPPSPDSCLQTPDPHVFKLLFLAHCTREKGLFAAMDTVVEVNGILGEERQGPGDRGQGTGISVSLTVAGAFMDEDTKAGFEQRVSEINQAAGGSLITYAGFLNGQEKDSAMRGHDCLLFPTHYPGETFGLVTIEALAYGMIPVTSQWRGVAEIAGQEDTLTLIERLLKKRTDSDPGALRKRFLTHYVVTAFHEAMKRALTF